MSKYPPLSGRKIIRALEKLGFEVVKQKGSHIKLRKYSGGRKITTVVPDHKSIATGTLKGILELAEIEAKEFSKYL